MVGTECLDCSVEFRMVAELPALESGKESERMDLLVVGTDESQSCLCSNCPKKCC